MRRFLLVALCLMCCVLPNPGKAAQSADPITLTAAEAVRAPWDSPAPPATGWVPVKLPDEWNERWPGFDGVVWYRVRWQQKDASVPIGMLLDEVRMAGAIYANGALLERDRSLTDPLSRGWIKPRYFVLGAPLLREGENTLLVRVSGLAIYNPSLDTIAIGDAEALRAEYEHSVFIRRDLRLISFAIGAALGVIFLLMWLLRRQDTYFAWYAIGKLVDSIYRYSQVSSNPWPFASTDSYQAFGAAFYVMAFGCWSMFLLRYAQRRYPKLEALMWAPCLFALCAAWVAPHWLGEHRSTWFFVGIVLYYASTLWFIAHALRSGRRDDRVLAAFLMIPLLVTVYSLMGAYGWLRVNIHVIGVAEFLSLLGVAFAMAYRFIAAMRRIEGFNIELRREVDAATTQLMHTLDREHALALAKSRVEERLQLTRDLHDGFGGTLIGTIARLEAAPDAMPKVQVVETLKEMRDDLRLVIDSTTHEHADLAELLRPLRYRFGQLLDSVDIESAWHLQGGEGVELDGGRNLDLLRLLQESLTNVFKHSRASRVEVHIDRDATGLELRIIDDGQGLAGASQAAASGSEGAGLASMRLRARRLGGELNIESTERGTQVRVAFPLSTTSGHPAGPAPAVREPMTP